MFNKEFRFGVATSAYQIEGTKTNDGNLQSIWDSFAKMPGAIEDSSDGTVACEHVSRYKEDVAIIKALGVDSYRFSISWTRIMPKQGVVSKEGVNFYLSLLGELKANGLKSSVTMYHWDMPQWVYELNGGWISRDTVYLFLDYAKCIIDLFDEHVDEWVTFNEPFCSSFLGYGIGTHAPGHKNIKEYLLAAHHINLAHGLAVEYYKKSHSKQIGIVINVCPGFARDNSIENQIAKEMMECNLDRMHLMPIFKGKYPTIYLAILAKHIDNFDFIMDGDMDIVSVDIDFLGINYYTIAEVKYDKDNMLLMSKVKTNTKKTGMGWDVRPDGLHYIIKAIRQEYTDIPIVITENGSTWKDELIDGRVHDTDRIEYLDSHLKVVEQLNDEGMNIIGYYAWSLMDNFEWSNGYTKRFGLVYVDYESQKRYLKDSYYRYKEIILNRKV